LTERISTPIRELAWPAASLSGAALAAFDWTAA